MTNDTELTGLERIFAGGNRTDFDYENETAEQWDARRKALPSNEIICADGFSVSVIAGWGTYCSPRPDWFNNVPRSYAGPYYEVEVGYPTARPEPWGDWAEYCENDTDPTGAVYACVPIEMVRALVASHGGQVA